MARRWCTLDDIPRLTRQRVLDANDVLDAMDEAAEREREKQRAEAERRRQK